MATVRARRARVGWRYYTRKNILVEACATKSGKLSVNHSTSQVFFFVVDPKTLEADKSKRFPIEFFYPLLTAEKPRRPIGRSKHADKTWWAWAYEYDEFPEILLRFFKVNGFYLVSTHHYFRVGKNGKTFLALYRKGILAFPTVPWLHKDLPLEKVETDFNPWRIHLKTVCAAGKENVLLALLKEYLKVTHAA